MKSHSLLAALLLLDAVLSATLYVHVFFAQTKLQGVRLFVVNLLSQKLCIGLCQCPHHQATEKHPKSLPAAQENIKKLQLPALSFAAKPTLVGHETRRTRTLSPHISPFLSRIIDECSYPLHLLPYLCLLVRCRGGFKSPKTRKTWLCTQFSPSSIMHSFCRGKRVSHLSHPPLSEAIAKSCCIVGGFPVIAQLDCNFPVFGRRLAKNVFPKNVFPSTYMTPAVHRPGGFLW